MRTYVLNYILLAAAEVVKPLLRILALHSNEFRDMKREKSSITPLPNWKEVLNRYLLDIQ